MKINIELDRGWAYALVVAVLIVCSAVVGQSYIQHTAPDVAVRK